MASITYTGDMLSELAVVATICDRWGWPLTLDNGFSRGGVWVTVAEDPNTRQPLATAATVALRTVTTARADGRTVTPGEVLGALVASAPGACPDCQGHHG